jgi:anti-sigma factor RsiW
MDWNCTLTENRLSDFLDGNLSRAEAAAFEAHAATCAKCAPMVAEVRSLVLRMHGLEEVPVPPLLMTRIINATSGPRKESAGWKSWFSWGNSLLQQRLLVGAATVMATILLVLYTAGISPTHLKHADLSPATVLRNANRQAHLTFAKSVKFVNDLRVVYEIQTRLQPDLETPPPAQQQEQAPAPKPQEKSQTSPNPGHSQARTGVMLASMEELILARRISRGLLHG